MDNITRTALIHKSISVIQAEMELLKKIGVHLYDQENEEWAVERLYYSEKLDEFMLEFVEIKKETELEYISGWSNRGA
jgi:hypothetical protein